MGQMAADENALTIWQSAFGIRHSVCACPFAFALLTGLPHTNILVNYQADFFR